MTSREIYTLRIYTDQIKGNWKMGLSASQARLLSLTSRLSALELKAQSISNAKTRLSNEGTAASNAYSQALDNQKMTVYAGVNGDGASVYKDATAYNLTSYGAVSNTDKQRFITNQSGQILISESILNAYNTSGGNLETFLNNLDQTSSPPIVQQQNLETTLTNNYTSSLAAVNGLMTTRTDYVPTGQNTPVSSFMTNYNDSAIFQALNSKNSSAYKANPDSSNVIQFYHDGSGNGSNDVNMQAALAALSTEVSTVTTATASAVIAALQSSFSASDWSVMGPKITAAATQAQADTATFYAGKCNNYNNFTGNDDGNTATTNLTANTNDIYNNSHGANELYIDRTQEIKTFLAFFDQECANINNGQAAGKTGQYSNQMTGNLHQTTTETTTYNTSYDKSGFSTAANVVQFYHDGAGNSSSDVNLTAALAALSTQLSGVTSSTASSIIAQLQNSFSASDWSVIGPQITAAVNQAKTDTASFYANQCNNYVHQTTSNHSDNHYTINDAAGNNKVWNDVYGENELYTDQGQEVQTFLNYVDQELAKITPTQTTVSSVNNTNGCTNREAHGGIGASNDVVGNDPITNRVTSPDSSATPQAMEGALQSVYDSLNAVSNRFGDAAGVSASKASLMAIINALKGGASVSSEAPSIQTVLSSLPTSTALKSAMDGIDITSQFPQYPYDPAKVDYYSNVFDQIQNNGAFSATDDNMNNTDWLQSQITAGNLFLYTADNSTGEYKNVSWTSGDVTLKEESKDTDTAKAEAKYQSTMADISAKDNRFDMQLKNIDTEHTAIQTEVGSVNKVIEKNIEKSFKIFDA